jgi:succinoglycan biosynthesis transport protein ExoP
VGSMQEVMRKVRTGLGVGTAYDTALNDATAFSFVAESGDTPPPQAGAAVVDDRTTDWDASKLDPALVAYHERYSPASEQYRSLRARLLNMNPRRMHQSIVITSSIPQEGKSITAINLGMVMAEGSEYKVCLVDADFRRSSVARMLGISPSPGLAELVRGTATLSDVLRPTPLPNLKVITAGSAADKKYGELFGASAMGTVLARLRDTFDYSFLDTPPVNTVSDVSMLAPHCDGAIIVIEMRRTPEPSVQEAVRTLQTTNVKILGCLLSRYNDQRGHYYERYYSYYTSA